MGYNRGYREWLHLPLERDIIVNAAVAILRGQKLQGVAYLEGRFKSRYYGIVTSSIRALKHSKQYYRITRMFCEHQHNYANFVRIDQFTTIKYW